MLFLVLIVAFFVGASTTDAFIGDSFAANDDNNGNNGCENANPNAKACESNPNTEPKTCSDCYDEYIEVNALCGDDALCKAEAYSAYLTCHALVSSSTTCGPALPPTR